MSASGRFEQVDQRFDELTAEMNRRFDELTAEMNRRFDELARQGRALNEDVRADLRKVIEGHGRLQPEGERSRPPRQPAR
jgi:hypothetical protein